jgi:hypothetical protein
MAARCAITAAEHMRRIGLMISFAAQPIWRGQGFALMFVVLLVGCTRSSVVTLDAARDHFEKSAVAYRACMNAIGGDHTCIPEQLIMEADQKAYADAMSTGLPTQSR